MWFLIVGVLKPWQFTLPAMIHLCNGLNGFWVHAKCYNAMVPLLIVTKICCSHSGWKSRRARGPGPDGVPGSSCSRGRQVCFTVVLIKAFWTYKEIILQRERHKVRDVPICVTIRRGTVMMMIEAAVWWHYSSVQRFCFCYTRVWKMRWPFEVTMKRNGCSHNNDWATNEDGCLHVHQLHFELLISLRSRNSGGQDKLTYYRLRVWHLFKHSAVQARRWQVA